MNKLRLPRRRLLTTLPKKRRNRPSIARDSERRKKPILESTKKLLRLKKTPLRRLSKQLMRPLSLKKL